MRISKLILCTNLILMSVSGLSLGAIPSDGDAVAVPCDQCTPMWGPFQIGVSYSNRFSVAVNTKWVNYLIYPKTAFGFELDFGGGIFRLGGTLGQGLTPNQRVKISAEHFAQYFNLNFAAGHDKQWVGQNAVGATYEYIVPYSSWIQNFEANAYYAKAESEFVGTKTFSVGPNTFTNLQHFAGGSLGGASGTITFTPWRFAELGVGLNYDSLHYTPLYQSVSNRSGIGATLTLDQIVTDRIRVGLGGTDRAPFSQVQVNAGYLIPSRPGTRWEVLLLGSRTQSHSFAGTDDTAMVTMAYSWGGSPDSPIVTYSSQDPNDMLLWTNKPAVYMPAVFAVMDQKIIF